MDGVGITMEAIGQNYLMYEAMLENRWRSAPIPPGQWLNDYVQRRYGEKIGKSDEVQSAWVLLLSDVFYAPYHNESYIESVPVIRDLVDDTFEVRDSAGKLHTRSRAGFKASLDNLWKAWKLLLSTKLDLRCR